MNTQEYAIEVSEDGTEYTQVARWSRATLKVPRPTPLPRSMPVTSSWWLTKPTQGSDTAARICEMQVRGADGAIL